VVNNRNEIMKVFVYFNLHRKCWSVKALEGPRKGLVIQHCNEIKLRDITFKVSEAGRQRVLAEQRKNVHAGVVGFTTDEIFPAEAPIMVSYNPYKAGHFYNKETGEAVYSGKAAYLADRKVWVS
jgi:hypothetical protein